LTDDPAIDAVIGCVLHSSADPRQHSWPPPIIVRSGWAFFDVGSADRFLDEFTADTIAPATDEGWRRRTFRELDEVGVITGPVERIVLADLEKLWPAGRRSWHDRTRWRRNKPWGTKAAAGQTCSELVRTVLSLP
jgi:hypothetical protein